MPPRLWSSLALLCSCVLLGCAGTAEPGPDPSPSAPDPWVAPADGLLPDPDAALAPDLETSDATDAGAALLDGAACSAVIPLGKYKGDLTGGATGVIVFNVVAGPTVGAGKFKITQPKEATYPLTLGGLDCDKLHIAIARPEGTTGGTDLRGSIAGQFKASQVFAGTWTMPFGSGKFKASLQP